MNDTATVNSEYADFWNDVLADKFEQFRNILMEGLGYHSNVPQANLQLPPGAKVLGAGALQTKRRDHHGFQLLDHYRPASGAVKPMATLACGATGYDGGFEPLVGHLDVLDYRGLPHLSRGGEHPTSPGFHFNGYRVSMTGQLIHIRRAAGRIARSIARYLSNQPNNDWVCKRKTS